MIDELETILTRLAALEQEVITLESEIDSMADRLIYLDKPEAERVPILDKRRYTRERLTEIQGEIVQLKIQKELVYAQMGEKRI